MIQEEEEDPSRMPRGWMFQAENLVSLILQLLRDAWIHESRPLFVSVRLWKLQSLFLSCSFIKSFDECWPIFLQLLQQGVLFSLPTRMANVLPVAYSPEDKF